MNRIWIVLALLAMVGCKTVYYGTMEKLGYHKRDIMVERVTEARDDQEQAKEQFQTALTKFSSVVKVDGGNLEKKYKVLQAEFDRCESDARAVTKRIRSVEEVATALFKEWEAELEQYSNAQLRSSSQQRLSKTRSKYSQMISAMRRAESKMNPVLDAFRDQVLFLKHNLNARAIASIQGEVTSLEGDVAKLISDMETSINEANAFIVSMGDS